MGAPSPQERESRFRGWWNRLTHDQQVHEVRSGHVRVKLPPLPEKPQKTANQRKAERRREREAMNLDMLKRLWKAKSLWGGIKDLTANGFDWKHAVKNAGMNFAILCSALAAASIADYFEIPAHIDLLFGWLPESIRSGAHDLLAPAIGTWIYTLRNWAKNRQNEIVWVVPVQAPTARQLTGDKAPTMIVEAVPVPLSVSPKKLGPPSPVEPLTTQGVNP